MFFAKFNPVINQCSPCGTLIVVGDFNAVTDSEGHGCELCVGPLAQASETNCLLENFTESGGLRIAGSLFKKHEPHHWS